VLCCGGGCWLAVRWQEVEGTVRPVLVVVATVDAEHLLKMAATDDEDPVETVRADGAHPTLGVGVRVRGPDGRADDSDALCPEHLVEGMAELRVTIADEKPEPLLGAELLREVAGLLHNPASVRVRRAGDVLDPPLLERDEEQHVDPPQEGGLDSDEVAREHARSLRSQERSPR